MDLLEVYTMNNRDRAQVILADVIKPGKNPFWLVCSALDAAERRGREGERERCSRLIFQFWKESATLENRKECLKVIEGGK